MASQEPGLERMELLIGNMRGLDQMILKSLSNSLICHSRHTSLCIGASFPAYSATQKHTHSITSSEVWRVRSYLPPKINRMPINISMKAGTGPNSYIRLKNRERSEVI